MKLIEIAGPLDIEWQSKLKVLHEDAFGQPMQESLAQHINKQVGLISFFSLKDNIPIGFKIGCINLNGRFCSWLGGVAKANRRQGVARKLLQKQHSWCVAQGYKVIETQTAGDNAAMLLLNVSEGYHIVGTVKGGDCSVVVSLRKALNQ
ncbi:MAG TPA: GNAT family N-acetyltransferase [Cellvibrionaceae bacterium]